MTGNLSPPNEEVTQPAGGELMDGFYIEDGNLYFLDHGKDGEPIEVYVGPEIHLGNIYEDFSTKHLTYEIVFMYRGGLRTILVPRNQFTASKLQSQHTNTGSPFLNSKKNALYIEYYQNRYGELGTTVAGGEIVEFDNSLVCFWDEELCVESECPDVEKCRAEALKVQRMDENFDGR